MAHLNRRSFQHIMEDNSVSIFLEKIPTEWVVRQYKPDYGIDLAIEIFDKIKGKKGIFETLGEHFFVQLKSCNKLQYSTINASPRINVELGPLEYHKDGEESSIDVVKFPLETNELLTIQHMGPAEIVLLILVGLQEKKVYFLCLNDYIDKVLIPEDPLWANKKHKTLLIPATNEIDRSNQSLLPIRFLAKRPKFYAAFEKFHYQYNWLTSSDPLYEDKGKGVNLISTFLANIKRLDIWRDTQTWAILSFYHDQMIQLMKLLNSKNIETEKITLSAEELWRGLTVLSRSYEEMCREWFLPTELSKMCSTPNEYTLGKQPTLPIQGGCISFRTQKKRKNG